MRILATIFSSFLALSALPANSQVFTGNDVYGTCESEDPVQTSFCVGYILASVEGLKWGAVMGVVATSNEMPEDVDQAANVALGFCIPPAVENRQVVEVVIAYLGNNPVTRHETARTLINTALEESWPCR